jgi:L-alanine-DL-glutamate epimerase-like enolase superfamily enzyme
MDNSDGGRTVSRRGMLGQVVGAVAATSVIAPPAGSVNRNSAPSQLKITDIRACTVASNFDYPIIRVDTNQGVYGLGEVRDGGVKGQALVLKPHIVGRDPLQIEDILARLRPFSGHGRLGGGYSAIDIALHDIAGKVYGVPVYRLVGSKLRDRIRVYCDTTISKDPKIYAQRMLARKKQGFTFFKMDLRTEEMVGHIPGAVNQRGVATEKGMKLLLEFVAAVRDAIGYEAPLSIDHFGPLDASDSIRYARALEPYQLAWAEDILQVGTLNSGSAPLNWRAYKEIKAATSTPLATGESLFGLEEGFRNFIDNDAVSIVHPDPGTSGAVRETKRIADYASMRGIQTAVHYAGGPVGCVAAVHMIATIKDFLAMENHAVDIPWWGDLVTGVPKPIVNQGFIQVPERPGLGVELNEAVVKEHLRHPGYFEPTREFDLPMVTFGIWERGPYPHITQDGTSRNALEDE